MDILMSFCNVNVPGYPALAVVDTNTFECRIPQLPQLDTPRSLSITGLAACEQHIYAAVQEPATGVSRLLVLDRIQLRLRNYYLFRLGRSVHSLLFTEGRLYAVSTGTDEVLEMEMRGWEVASESVFWRPESDAPRQDRHHLNAICRWRGELLVSCFGKKPSELWNSTRDGFVFSLTRNERIASGILHPHSLLVTSDSVAYCESGRMALRILGGSSVEQLPGYTRGLCHVGDQLFVGTSVGRLISKSTGLINNPGTQGIRTGRCTVCRVSAGDLKVEEVVDLTRYGQEIYDLLPLERSNQWRFVVNDQDDGRRQSKAIHELTTMVSPSESFILVDHEVLRPQLAEQYRAIPFLEREDRYWGPPADDKTALSELERLRQNGAKQIVFAWPAFWWLEYYPEFCSHLRSRFRCVLSNEHFIAFDLETAAVSSSEA